MRDGKMDEEFLIKSALNLTGEGYKSSAPEEPATMLPFTAASDLMKKARKEAKRSRKKKAHKKKPVSKWTAPDLVRYARELLRAYSIDLETQNYTADCQAINTLHDKLLLSVGESGVSNYLLREYFDWWCGIYAAKFEENHITLRWMIHDSMIANFVKRTTDPAMILEREMEAAEEPVVKVVTADLSDESDLAQVIIDVGIVEAYRLLKEKAHANPLSVITATLGDLSKTGIIKTMQRTLANGPYSPSDRVDFISVAQRTLVFHGLTQYLEIDYSEYFSEV